MQFPSFDPQIHACLHIFHLFVSEFSPGCTQISDPGFCQVAHVPLSLAHSWLLNAVVFTPDFFILQCHLKMLSYCCLSPFKIFLQFPPWRIQSQGQLVRKSVPLLGIFLLGLYCVSTFFTLFSSFFFFSSAPVNFWFVNWFTVNVPIGSFSIFWELGF